MANEEHLALLRRGVEVWNEWREKNPKISPDLRKADLTGADLTGANLREADLSSADLTGANLRMAYVSGANFSRAVLRKADLREANVTEKGFIGADFIEAGFKEQYLGGTYFNWADLTEADLTGADLRGAEVRWAKLIGANLRNAYFLGVKFNEADFTGADLTDADLSETQALSTNFSNTILTGTCIKDWNINRETKLDNVRCEYVYLKRNRKERRPHDETKNFAPGEFTKLFEKAREAVDLVFDNGVDWDAFAYSFKKVENEGEWLDVQSIEKKRDGDILVRVSVSLNADKAKIHSDFMQGYEFAQKVLEAQYQARFEDKDKHINQLFYFLNQANNELYNKLGEVQKLMAEAPKYDQRGSTFGTFIDTAQSGSHQEVTQNIYAQQTLAEAADEIQQLLTKLQTKGYSPEAAQEQAANDLATQAKSNPTVKDKLVKWRQDLGDAATKATLSEAVKEVLRLALKLSGVPLP